MDSAVWPHPIRIDGVVPPVSPTNRFHFGRTTATQLCSNGETLMLGDGLCSFGSVLEGSYALETDMRLRAELDAEYQREQIIEELQTATQISEKYVLTELVDCGLRADSLHVLTLAPMVHVAWANGYVERGERQEILAAAEEEGIQSDSEAYVLLSEWLSTRPSESLIETWKDYVAAVRLVLSPKSYAALHETTVRRATAVGNAAGGFFGFGAIRPAEQAAIDELESAF